jgi:tRNA (guanine26-N2/guanine27-N2)-dimethyltransferase
MPFYKEGKARVFFNDSSFLNPKARLIRDMSVAFLQAAQPGGPLLDCTTATGIRGIRYALEAGASDITMLDMNEKAFQAAKKNIRLNKVKASVLNKSIQEFANTSTRRFSVIDLDPFGGVAPYMHDLMKIVGDNGYIMLTATDGAVLCGAHQKACIRIYDAVPLHDELGHETGIRMLAGYVARVAAQFNLGIEVVMAVSHIHYMRLFVRFRHGSEAATASVKELGYAYHCSKCRHYESEKSPLPTRSICPNCGVKLSIGGKMWLGGLYDKDIVAAVERNMRSMGASEADLKLLQTMAEELDSPLFFMVPKITKHLGIKSVSPGSVISELKAGGYEATRTAFDPSGVKTNAGIRQVEKIVRQLASRS